MNAKVTTTTDISDDIQGRRTVDVVAFGIVTSAILLFTATGSVIGPDIVRALMGQSPGPDQFVLNAFLLNIAIIIFGWSRYRELNAELAVRTREEAAARRLAETDPLTGFLNRRSFGMRADVMIAKARESGRAVALMMIDLDNFKQVNDFNGHAAGDQLLRQCAARIREVVPIGSAIARIGGDEFVCLMTGERLRERAARCAEMIIAGLRQPIKTRGITAHLGASIGVVLYPDDGRCVESLRPD